MNAIPARVAGVRELAMVVPTPDGVRNPLVLAAAAIAGIDRGVHDRRRACDRGTRLRYRDDPRGRQDRRSRQRLCCRGQAPGVRHGRHRHDRRPVRDPGALRRIDRSRLDRDGPVLAGRARRTRAGDPALARCRLARRGRGVDRAADRRHAAARGDRDLARGSWRADRVRDLEEACDIVDRIAPGAPRTRGRRPGAAGRREIRHAGAIFCGRWSSEAIGDYCAGPNHVLPTMRTARFSSPLGVYDFQKRSSVIEVSAAGARTLGRIAATLARGERLEAHARSAEYRVDASVDHDADVDAARLAAGLVRPDVQAMAAYHVPPASGLLKLDAMENPWPLPEPLRAELGARLAEVALNRYPAADYSGAQGGDPCAASGCRPARRLVLGNGSDELISMLVNRSHRAQGGGPRRRWPSFVMYAMSPRIARQPFRRRAARGRVRARPAGDARGDRRSISRRWSSSPIRTTRLAAPSSARTLPRSSRTRPGWS